MQTRGIEEWGETELDDLTTWLWLLDLFLDLEKMKLEGKISRDIWSGHLTIALTHRTTAAVSKISRITLSALRSDL